MLVFGPEYITIQSANLQVTNFSGIGVGSRACEDHSQRREQMQITRRVE